MSSINYFHNKKWFFKRLIPIFFFVIILRIVLNSSVSKTSSKIKIQLLMSYIYFVFSYALHHTSPAGSKLKIWENKKKRDDIDKKKFYSPVRRAEEDDVDNDVQLLSSTSWGGHSELRVNLPPPLPYQPPILIIMLFMGLL